MNLISLTNEEKEEHKNWINVFETKYKFKFYNPTYNSIPNISDLVKEDKIKKCFKNIEYYLIGSYPIYMNTNVHSEMYKLRQQFTHEEYFWHKKHNKLGINRWGGALTNLGFSKSILNKNDLKIKIEIITPEKYSKMNLDNKIEYVTYIDKELYHIFQKIYLQYQLISLK